MPIPIEIKLHHLEKAFNEILKNGVPKQKKAINTVVKYNGLFFPVKLPITIAYKFVNGEEIPSQHERGNPSFTTHEAIKFFKCLEFEIYKIERIGSFTV